MTASPVPSRAAALAELVEAEAWARSARLWATGRPDGKLVTIDYRLR